MALLAGCQRSPDLRFNPVASVAATAPASAALGSDRGLSDVQLTGSVTWSTTRDFQCSSAIDDFFIRGVVGEVDGVPLYISVNVEFFKGPGRYPGKTQVLVRKVSDDSSYYAAWYAGSATITVWPRRDGADLEHIDLVAEGGGRAAGTVSIGGRFACAPRRA